MQYFQNNHDHPEYLRTSRRCWILLRRNKELSHLSGVPFNVCLFSTRAAYCYICPIKVPQTKRTALSRSWKKTPTSIRVSVSKLLVTFFLWCCGQTEGCGDCLLRFLGHTELDRDTMGWTPPNE